MNKSITSKALALLLAGGMLATSLACGGSSGSGNDTGASGDTTPSETTAELTDEEKRQLASDGVETVDYKGREFNILSRTNFVYEFDAEQTGDVIDDAIFARNSAIEERFNIDIITHAFGDGNAANVLTHADQSILAGDDAFQLISAYTYLAAPGGLNGNYMNWYEVPHVNFDQPWWSKGFIEEASINNRVYIATGDLSLLFNEVTLCMLFNKQLAEDYKLGNLYETVKSGDWTFERLREYAEIATQDLNGDGVMDKNDRFGLGINTYTHIDCFLYAFEVPVMNRDSDGIPQLAINSQKMLDVLDGVYSFLIDSGDVFIYKHGTDSFEPGMFENNQGLFMTTWLGNCGNLREMETDFGIIPYPKWNDEQENYCTYYLDRTDSFLIPVTADLDFVGGITEAMACESYKKVIPAFYDTALDSKYARDEDSKEMIDLILSNIRFDFGNIYTYKIGSGVGPGHLLRQCIPTQSTDFASLYAKNEPVYEANMAELLEAFIVE